MRLPSTLLDQDLYQKIYPALQLMRYPNSEAERARTGQDFREFTLSLDSFLDAHAGLVDDDDSPEPSEHRNDSSEPGGSLSGPPEPDENNDPSPEPHLSSS